MTTSRSGQQRTVRRLVAGAAVALLLVGCASSPAKVADIPTDLKPTAPPEPPAPDPVEGEVTLALKSVSNTTPLGLGSAQPADDDAVQDVVQAIAAWLDAHLDDLQQGQDRVWGDMAASGLADPAGHVTTALASPERHVDTATYAMTVFHDGEPQLVAVDLTVVHPDGATASAELLFAVSQGEPVLTLFGPGREAA